LATLFRTTRAWELPLGALEWVVSGYALTFGGFLLLGGRSGDPLGRRRVFMAGLVLFPFSRSCPASRFRPRC
jgi:MFS family permease